MSLLDFSLPFPALTFLALGPFLATGCGTDDDNSKEDTGMEDTGMEDTGMEDTGMEDTSTPSGFSFECDEPDQVFQAYDLSSMPPELIDVPATCRAEGDNSWLYVADDVWDVYVDQDQLEAFMQSFELATPDGSINPDQGIYQNDTEVFGALTADNYGADKVYILAMEFAEYGGYEFDGYLYIWNGIPMFQLNAAIRPLDDPETASIMAHEFVHVIQQAYDASEEQWMSEALAEVGMVVNGYYTDEAWVADYAADPSEPLVNNTASVHYGAVLLFGTYLYEQFGEELMGELNQEPSDGVAGLEASLQALGWDLWFDEILEDWMVANFLDDPALEDGSFGYSFMDIPSMTIDATLTAGEQYQDDIDYSGVRYIEVTGDQPATLVVESTDALDLLYSVILMSDAPQVTTLTEEGPALVAYLDGLGNSYDSAVLCLSTMANTDFRVSLQQ